MVFHPCSTGRAGGSHFVSGSVPHVSQFPAEDSAHGGEGSGGLLSSHRQGLRSLLIPVRGEKKMRERERWE
jgi:hypothetical protein